MRNFIKKYDSCFVFLCFVILINLFVIMFKANEKYIYFWDIAGYWTSVIESTNVAFTDFGTFLSTLYDSILYNEYNLFPTIFYILVFRFISNSNLAFTLTTLNLFFVPFVAIVYGILIKEKICKSVTQKIIVLIVLFTNTIALTPLLGGFLDSIGLLFIGIIFLIIYKSNIKKLNCKFIICLTIAVTFLCFTRRWYLFFIISLYISCFLNYILMCITRKSTIIELKNVFVNLFLSGILWLAILFVFFKPFLLAAIFNDFAYKYSAYNFGGTHYNLQFIVNQVGIFMCILSLLAIVISIVKHKNNTLILGLSIQFVVMFFLFSTIQSLGVQHLYLFVPFFMVTSSVCVIELIEICKSNVGKSIAASAITFFVILNFMGSYFKQINDNKIVQIVNPILSQKKLYTKVRTDIEEIKNLTEYLNTITDNKKYVYVLSSSSVLNSEILANVNLPKEKNAVNNLFYTRDVDKRDGFPDAFYASDFIVVADPIQYHLLPENQQIIGIIASEILDNNCDNSLELIKTYDLDENVKAKVYKKVKPYSKEFINKIDEKFKLAYPLDENISNTISIYSYIYDLNIESNKKIILLEKYKMGIELGKKTTDFKIKTNKQFNRISFNIKANYELDIKRKVTIKDENSNIISTSIIKSGENNIEVDVNNCDFIKLEFENLNSELTDIYMEIEFKLWK